MTVTALRRYIYCIAVYSCSLYRASKDLALYPGLEKSCEGRPRYEASKDYCGTYMLNESFIRSGYYYYCMFHCTIQRMFEHSKSVQ